MPHAKRAAAPPRETTPSPSKSVASAANKIGRPPKFYTDEFLAEAKRRIEHTSQSTTSIAGDFGMHQSVLSRLVKREGWVRPEGSLRLRGLSPAMRVAAEVDAMVRVASPPPERGRSATPDLIGGSRVGVIEPALTPTLTLPLSGGGNPSEFAASADAHDTSALDRLEAAVLKELSTVETMRASLGAEPLRPMDAERTARTLSTLTETLAKLRRLRLAQPQAGSDHDDDIPDIDEFRRDLARRINLFVASRTGGGNAAGAPDVAVETAG